MMDEFYKSSQFLMAVGNEKTYIMILITCGCILWMDLVVNFFLETSYFERKSFNVKLRMELSEYK